MAVNLAVEPFDVDFLPDWDNGAFESAGGDLTVDFFGHEIFSMKIKDGYVDEYDREKLKQAAIEVLGELIAERLSQKVQPLEYGGISIV